MPFFESFDEFKARMESDCEFIHNRFLFRNGAQSNGEYLHHEPPQNPVQLARLQNEFLTFRLERASKEFNDMKAYIDEQATMRLRYPNAVPPREDAVEILRRLQGRIFRLRASIAAIATAQESESREQVERRIFAELEQKERERVKQIMTEASQILI